MSKRGRTDDDSRPPKRPKPDHVLQAVVEEIHFARQLQELLTFRQDGIQQLRGGIASFKAFLESVCYHRDEDRRSRQLAILHEFLDSEKPADANDTERPFLAQLWQAWSFASQNNNDHLCSQISALFALLVKTLSSILDFRDHGVLLCRTILQHQHLRMIRRSLDAPKHKDFLISPCLRLLTEVTSFDGGLLAKEVYKRREQTFEPMALRRNLGAFKTDQSEEEARRRPAIRTLTIRYILTHLKYLHQGGKADLLKNRPLCTSLFHFLQDDPADVIAELLSATEQHVLKDADLPRSAKAALLVEHNLERVTDIATRSSADHAAFQTAFAWLKAVCSEPSCGVLRISGWYPPGTDRFSEDTLRADAIDLGLDSVDFYDRDQKPNVRNTVLLTWIQTLRPHSNLRERELLLTCFRSAPELVAAYFAEKNMQLEPKLSNTWIGYASLLFEVVQLDLPAFLGYEDGWAQLPPQTYIMLDSILPRSLTQKVLTRCLNQSNDLIRFFAVRILVMALQKLSEVQLQLAKGSDSAVSKTELWKEASERLHEAFVERFPAMKDVVGAFRKIPNDDEHLLQQEAVTHLLRLCYEVLPLQAAAEPFDISAPLTAALVKTDPIATAEEALQSIRLEHLLQIARRSPGMRWLTKQGALEHSPLMTLLKIHAENVNDRQVRDLICGVLAEHSILSTASGLDALVAVLHHLAPVSEAVASFLDDCFSRANKQPVKYLDDMEAMVAKHADDHEGPRTLPSILPAVLGEQAAYVGNRPRKEQSEIATFIIGYFDLLRWTAEAKDGLELIRESFESLDRFQVLEELHDPKSTLLNVEISRAPIATEENVKATGPVHVLPFSAPSAESENHPELLKWSQKDLGLAIEDGDIAALMLCLSSQYPEIRSQALVQLHRVLEKVLESTLEDKMQIYFLLGELIETYEHPIETSSDATPYLVTCFATHALEIEIQPVHYLYPKINRFLNKGPAWRPSKLPTHLLKRTVLSEPEEDDSYWKEVQWVLDWLVDGTRTVDDLEILRKGKVFEQIMSLCSSPGSGARVKERVLELLWRVTFIEGGSTTLIKRTGSLSWLNMVPGEERIAGLMQGLRKRIVETCDQEEIEEWGGVSIDIM
ncbi:uncharacterized protein LTR77_009391 [Saxophila tyrrhenica]|uniref:Nucleolar pre-ribosomal-associated protein 1 n=1 Tax=Saxophila tyrrhenica TaxID=1690608 RepID=A0AAV9P2U8_9PEZI|nr:hypothetical protein LTR77_009391 [Saxophila tyrrhenica]